MFEPLSTDNIAGAHTASSKKRAVEVTEFDDTIEILDGHHLELLQAVSKGFLQLSEEARHRARSENIVIQAETEHVFMRSMESSATAYSDKGTTARSTLDFKGHPWGKKPDAMFRALLVRFSEMLNSDVCKHLTMQGDASKMLQAALDTIGYYAGLAHEHSPEVTVVRCFRVNLEDGSRKWIFFSTLEDLMKAFRTLRVAHFLADVGLKIDYDGAPRNEQSKIIHRLLYAQKQSRGAKRSQMAIPPRQRRGGAASLVKKPIAEAQAEQENRVTQKSVG
eukprot:TRINITY_DN12365_c0_g1_i5.p1 TRINITY_DN12365_c0_g1~~TRINITY_DN12365_c0_g1_i5.p1  ORF type:complete len:278 (+),score=41.75 TRINITY_DN12365_c0_g1_i5:81-914(+)